MRPLTRLLTLLTIALLVMAACGGDDDSADGDATTTTETTEAASAGGGAGDDDDQGTDNTTPSQGRIELMATLSGDAEVPGPGDADGSGDADVTIDVSNNEVCVQYRSIEGLAEITAAHIHRGTESESGPIVITLPTPEEGTDDEPRCSRDADRDAVTEVTGNPEGFYVNVHTQEFPNGAIRGQLEQAS